MEVAISSALLARIRAEAASSRDEICGLLFGALDRIDAAEPCRNVAADPRRRFEIESVALLAAHRAARAGGPRLVGCYHSHPSGDAIPSARDAADAEPNGWLWLIVGAGGARLFRTVQGGALHGRFDEVIASQR
ncbi:M67 family metallopeptidase [Sphingomonas sp.]|uniref:M67 family metallopeptidase n=1 Tax=Sphingomonas sp. TaxID=28214 RepID=UPI002D7F5FBB|nr:M67 family metallopeptidase [Sphingomonas sp.]HEU0043566.1 M67 family metallopeptidase [Sphingomonas sp.]